MFLDNDLVRRVDYYKDENHIRHRVQAVTILLDTALGNSKKKKK